MPSMGDEEAAMVCEEEEDEVIAACALCPNEDCGSLVIAYRAAGIASAEPWNFVCSRCGTDFSMPEEELVCQSLALATLLGKSSHIAYA